MKLKRLEDLAEAFHSNRSNEFLIKVHDALFHVGDGKAPSYLGCTYSNPISLSWLDVGIPLPIRKLPAHLFVWVKDELFRRGDVAF